jgi:hypothetical protein
MNRLVIASAVAIVASGVALLACSSTPAYCSNGSTLGTTLQTKFGNCDAGGITLSGRNCTNTSGCTTAYNQCAASDQTALVAQENCIINAPTCAAGGELNWFLGLAACAGDAGSVSAACTGFFQAAFPDGGC